MAGRRVIISVANKKGAVDFARALKEIGWEIVSTGGTASLLKGAGVEVTEISQVTGFPEILGGRVKTLHPAVHGGILCRRDNAGDMEQVRSLGLTLVDMVVCNLYPFAQTAAKPNVSLEDVMEEIDVGGHTLLRASAKNWESVTVVCDPDRYDQVVGEIREEGFVTRDTRRRLAWEAFSHTAAYDSSIAAYLGAQWYGWPLNFPGELAMGFKKVLSLRYGENPHQKAAFYEPQVPSGTISLAGGRGKGLSYNNINDADTALRAVWDLRAPACVIVKHGTPCGVAVGSFAAEAYKKALAADPVSAFGSVIAFNCEVDGVCAKALRRLFVEVLVAPSFSQEALEILSSKKDLRIVAASRPGETAFASRHRFTLRQALGGILVQNEDIQLPQDENWQTVSSRQPTAKEIEDLRFAMIVCKHVKSNAIVLAKDGVTVGIGGGQPNRVDCVRIAVDRGKDSVKGSVMASDAFFPFPDSVEVAAAAGISAIVHPGGSKKDDESLTVANRHGIAMVYSGARHFRH